MSHFNIVVSVPEPDNTAFIASPFDSEFNEIKYRIRAAIGAAGLTAMEVDPDLGIDNPDFVKDIKNKIRKARVIIAVCSPEAQTNKSNPNVMYELGFAQSIGKATVIVTNDIAALPADLKTQNAIKYILGEEDRARDKLIITINMARDRTEPGKNVDTKTYPDIKIALPRHWLVINPELMNNLTNILFYGKEIHNTFQSLNSNTNGIDRMTTELFGGKIPSESMNGKISECQTIFGQFFLDHDRNISRILNSLIESDLSPDFQALLSLPTYKSVHKAEEYWTNCQTLTSDYLSANNSLNEYIESGIAEVIKHPEDIETLWKKTTALKKLINDAATQADSLIREMIKIILSE